MVSFGPFALDMENEQLWHDTRLIALKPKTFAVLRYLVQRAGQLVTKDDLLATLWPATYVSEAALTVCIGELRKALGERAKAPQYIATVHRRGYRFIAPLQTPAAVQEPPRAGAGGHGVSPTRPGPGAPVGREAELAHLQHCWQRAQQGERQMVFLTGEPGIGKTTVVQAFVAHLETTEDLWHGHGQCIDHYGVGEAYLPVLEALGRLCRGADGDRVSALLEHYAPTWLGHLPTVFRAEAVATLTRHVSGTTPERMLRELAEAVEALTTVRPLLLTFEDLHWSDTSTLVLLSALARRPDPARLLVLGTYRPVEVIVRQHPLKAVKQDLLLRGACVEVPLPLWSVPAVEAWLATLGHDAHLAARLADLLHQRTEGNPLFVWHVLAALQQQGVLTLRQSRWQVHGDVEAAVRQVPESLRQMIEHQLDQLAPEAHTVLQVGSVAGMTFAAAAVAAQTGYEVEVVEELCEGLAQRQHLVQADGVEAWPDGTVSARYVFRHALYPDVLYNRIPASRRQRLHRQLGAQLEAAYGARASDIAAELARHFEHGWEARRAVQYRHAAADNALRRSAHHEGLEHLSRALALLAGVPDTPARRQQELDLQVTLGHALMATRGQAAPDVERAYARAQELCQQVGDTPQLFPVLRGLMVHYLVRGQLQTAHQLGEELLHLAQSPPDPARLMIAHHHLGMVVFYRGEPATAQTHHRQALAIYTPQAHRVLTRRYGMDFGVGAGSHLAWELWQLGYPDQALQHSQAACTLAQEVAHSHSLALALVFAAIVHQCRREAPAVHEQAVAAIGLATAQGFAFWAARARVLHGWALALQGQGEAGIAEMHQGLAASLATGARVWQPYCLGLLAEAYGQSGHPEAGLPLLDEALAVMEHTGDRSYGAELYRLKGVLFLRQAAPDAPQAEACLREAYAIACSQHATSLALRAATSLARLWQQQGQGRAASDLLTPVYGCFTEGFDTADLQEAKALLEELRGEPGQMHGTDSNITGGVWIPNA